MAGLGGLQTAARFRVPQACGRTLRTCFSRAAERSILYRQTHTRGYARQAFNYQRYKASSNVFKRWAARPTFYYEIGGLGAAGGGFYLYNLEAVPVRLMWHVMTSEILTGDP